MSSILQVLFAFPAFQTRYGRLGDHAETCTVALPAGCFECQMRKIADGLLSGRHSVFKLSHKSDGNQAATVISQVGIRPVAFKALVGRDNFMFSTTTQQDASMFFLHLLNIMRQDERKRTRGTTAYMHLCSPSSVELTLLLKWLLLDANQLRFSHSV